jgi:FtsZ-interacting cell division protein ZipA
MMSGIITIIVILVILWWLNNNKTTAKNKITVREVKTFKTNDGFISYEQQTEIDERRMNIANEGINNFKNRPIRDPVVTEKIVNAAINHSKPSAENPRMIARENKPVARTETIKTSHPAKDIKTYSVESYLKNKGESLTPTLLEMAERLSKNKQAPSGVVEKQCLNCHQSLPAASFRPSSKNPDGLTKWCSNCLGSSTERRGRFKMCPKCGKRRMKSSFDQNSTRPDGLTKWCRYCMAGINR